MTDLTLWKLSPSFFAAFCSVAVLFYFLDPIAATVMAIIAVVTVPTRQILMPAINLASDHGAKQKFKILHSLSVLITLSQIIGCGYVLARFV